MQAGCRCGSAVRGAAGQGRRVRIAVTGSSGLIGSALVPRLRADGHDVVRLVRRAPASSDEAEWDPQGGSVDPAALEGTDAVVHLAGAGVGDKRWDDEYRQLIRDSRVEGTTTLSRAIADATDRPSVLLCGSAVGYYGSRGDEVLDEESLPGDDFLADVCVEWEAATQPAQDAGVRVAFLRTGLVMSPDGGALERSLLPFRLGGGGPLGSGKQWWSSISLPDEVRAIEFLLEHDVSGPVNLVGPHPVRNKEWAKALGDVLNRPALLPVPRFALRVLLDGFADEGVLASQRVLPRRLLDEGFTFAHPETRDMFRAVLDRR